MGRWGGWKGWLLRGGEDGGRGKRFDVNIFGGCLNWLKYIRKTLQWVSGLFSPAISA